MGKLTKIIILAGNQKYKSSEKEGFKSSKTTKDSWGCRLSFAFIVYLYFLQIYHFKPNRETYSKPRNTFTHSKINHSKLLLILDVQWLWGKGQYFGRCHQAVAVFSVVLIK